MTQAAVENDERRRYGRVQPVQRYRGMAGDVVMYLVDLSLFGLRVAHQDPLPPVGSVVQVTFEYEGRRFRAECEVRRTEVERKARTRFEKALHHTGLQILRKDIASELILKDMIASCVARALDEQKANAKGIPAMAAQSVQTGKGDELVRCELRNGGWLQTTTFEKHQPLEGFTISAAETPQKIAMLCRAYENGDAEGRRLIRTFAALSISKSEGIPTRRYAP